MIKFRCSHCNQKLGVPDEYEGRRIRCNKCDLSCVVPAVEEVAEIAEVAVGAASVESEGDGGGMDFFAGLEDAGEVSEEGREAAIRQAREKGQAEIAGNVNPDAVVGSDKPVRVSISDMVPDIVRFPLSLVLSALAMGAVVLIWILCSRASENALCFFAVFVPVAGALGLRKLTIEPSFLMGVLAILIGIGRYSRWEGRDSEI